MERCPRCGSQIILVDRSDKAEAVCAYCRFKVRTYVLLKMPKLTKITLLIGFPLLLSGVLLFIFTSTTSLAENVVLGISVALIFFAVINLLRTRT